MKTRILSFVILSLFCVSFAIGQTGKVNPDPKMQVKQAVASKVVYPEFAVDLGIEGIVYASFNILPDGSIQVVQIESTNKELKDYVSKKLKEIKVNCNEEASTDVYNMKFRFELI